MEIEVVEAEEERRWLKEEAMVEGGGCWSDDGDGR